MTSTFAKLVSQSVKFGIKKNNLLGFKGKSPEVPFQGITLPYSYFEVVWIFAPIQKEAKHDQIFLSIEQK